MCGLINREIRHSFRTKPTHRHEAWIQCWVNILCSLGWTQPVRQSHSAPLFAPQGNPSPLGVFYASVASRKFISGWPSISFVIANDVVGHVDLEIERRSIAGDWHNNTCWPCSLCIPCCNNFEFL